MSLWKVQLFSLDYDDRERTAVDEVIRSGWITMGERVISFEKAFADFLGGGVSCTAVSSGTAALHMALLATGVGEGDEVIIPALTFVADANVVRLVGAHPVLADCVSLDDWNISAERLVDRFTKRTKAVIVVHYAGYPCDMSKIMAACHAQKLFLLEDAAHAPGAAIDSRMCGTFSDISCFSFFSNKNLSIGEGGMVAASDQQLHERLRRLRSHGMTTLTLDRHEGRAITYDVVAPGLNYRMDEIRAAIGLVQLSKLTNGNRRREELTLRYRNRLSGSPVHIPFASLPKGARAAHHILPVLLPANCERLSVIEHLKRHGVQSSIHYPSFWSFSAYQEMFSRNDTPIATEIQRRELTLPLYPGMRDEDVDYVVNCLLDALS